MIVLFETNLSGLSFGEVIMKNCIIELFTSETKEIGCDAPHRGSTPDLSEDRWRSK